MSPLVAHCHLGLGKLYRRTGQREHAWEHLTTATAMYREMDMRFWPEQAEAEGAWRVTCPQCAFENPPAMVVGAGMTSFVKAMQHDKVTELYASRRQFES